MATFYVPYLGDRPATLDIKGHRLVILSKSKAPLEDGLLLVGGERIEKLRTAQNKEAEVEMLTQIGRSANSGIVIAPKDLPVSDVIRNLEAQLPWLQ